MLRYRIGDRVKVIKLIDTDFDDSEDEESYTNLVGTSFKISKISNFNSDYHSDDSPRYIYYKDSHHTFAADELILVERLEYYDIIE